MATTGKVRRRRTFFTHKAATAFGQRSPKMMADRRAAGVNPPQAGHHQTRNRSTCPTLQGDTRQGKR